MKRIVFSVGFAAWMAVSALGQDTATQQQIDKLSGQIQDVLAAQGKQDQAIAELRKEIAELREKVSTPQVNNSASVEDLKALTEKVQEIDRKRQEDRELILKEIDKLAKAAAMPSPVRPKTPTVTPKTTEDNGTAPATPQKGYEHVVAKGETLAAIAKAYRDQGVKVTTKQILAANPGLDANKLYVGKTIFIPDPNAK